MKRIRVISGAEGPQAAIAEPTAASIDDPHHQVRDKEQRHKAVQLADAAAQVDQLEQTTCLTALRQTHRTFDTQLLDAKLV